MYKNILIPTDGSALSFSSGLKGIRFARSIKAKVIIMTVSPTHKKMMVEGFFVPEPSVNKKKWKEIAESRMQKILSHLANEAQALGVQCETKHVFDDRAYNGILKVAKSEKCDLIAIGSHGYGALKQLVMGSQTMQVLSQSKIPVLVYR